MRIVSIKNRGSEPLSMFNVQKSGKHESIYDMIYSYRYSGLMMKQQQKYNTINITDKSLSSSRFRYDQ